MGKSRVKSSLSSLMIVRLLRSGFYSFGGGVPGPGRMWPVMMRFHGEDLFRATGAGYGSAYGSASEYREHPSLFQKACGLESLFPGFIGTDHDPIPCFLRRDLTGRNLHFFPLQHGFFPVGFGEERGSEGTDMNLPGPVRSWPDQTLQGDFRDFKLLVDSDEVDVGDFRI
jgi:hypothetical protein